MAVEPIQVEAEDEVPTIIERIRRTPAEEVHLVLPARSRFGQSRFNFQLLKQYTTRLGKRVAVVSADPTVQRFAEESGFGALGPPQLHFEGDGHAVLPLPPGGTPRQRGGAGMRTGATPPPVGARGLDGVAGMWPPAGGRFDNGAPPPAPGVPAGARLAGQPGRAISGVPARIRIGAPRRMPALIGSQEATRLLLYTGAAIVALAGMFLLAFVVPSAHVTLVVKASPFSTGVDVLAQPGKPPIRVRTVTVTKSDSMAGQSTGSKNVDGQYATGQVTYANTCQQEMVLPNGQRLRAVTGMIFAQIGDQRVAPGNSATVNVKATQPGQAGNVGAGQINTIEPNQYSNCLSAANAQATNGGADGQKQVVIQSSDFQSVRAQLEQKLRQQVLDDLTHGAQQGETMVKDPVWKTDDFETTHQVDDQVPNFTGSLKLVAEGDYYVTDDVKQVFAGTLASKVRRDQELTANPVTTNYAVTASGGGQLEFSGTASGYITNRIDTERVKGQLVGKTGGAARSVLDQLPVTRAEIAQSPFPLPLMPLTTSHITVDYAVDQILPPTQSG